MTLGKLTRFSILIALMSFLGFAVVSVSAATGATLTFLDTFNQPEFQVDGTGLVEDEVGCDFVTVVMTDATGGATDIDIMCIDLLIGSDVNFTDWGSFEGGYMPVLGPITYTVFDTGVGDACYNDENSQACLDFLMSGATCLAEAYYQPAGLPGGTPFAVCGDAVGTGVSGVACPYPLPAGSTVQNIPAGALTYFQASADAYTGFNLPPGTWYVSETDGDFAKVWIACQASPVWVPTANIAG